MATLCFVVSFGPLLYKYKLRSTWFKLESFLRKPFVSDLNMYSTYAGDYLKKLKLKTSECMIITYTSI